MSSLITNLRSLFGPPDPRSEPEIDRDLEDEFAFHIDMLERELIDAGMPRERAAELARARFGNVDRLRTQCRRIALEDRHMMQKINFVLMIIVMLAVVGVSIQMLVTQRYNALALQDITTQIAKMRIDARLEAREWAGVPDSSEARTPHIMIEGLVENPGWYPIETDPPTLLHEIVQQARPAAEADIVVYRRSGRTGTKNYAVADLLSESPERILVTAGDTIHVDRTGDNARSNQVPSGGPALGQDRSLLTGRWQGIVAEESASPERASITIIGTDNVRNLRGHPHGSLTLPQQGIELDLTFMNMTSGPELRILEPEAANEFDWRPQSFPGNAARGRWAIEDDGTLLLNITPAVPEITEPLRFRRVETEKAQG